MNVCGTIGVNVGVLEKRKRFERIVHIECIFIVEDQDEFDYMDVIKRTE